MAPLMHTRDNVSHSTFSLRVKSHIKRAMVQGKRRGAWFSLNRREKSIMYLSVKLPVKFESLDLLRALASVLKKLGERGNTVHAWFQRGVKLAWAFSAFAVSSGNPGAKLWRNDREYAVYLGKSMASDPGGPRFT